MNDIKLINLSNYVRPEIKEVYGRKWILNGENNKFFDYIIDRYHGSPTNESIINVYCSLLFGQGLAIKGQEELYEELNDIFPKNEQRKVLNDFKLFGMFSAKLIRSVGGGVGMIKHFPIDKLGMDKANDKGVIENVWYCYDWKEKHKYKPVEMPVFQGRMTEREMILLGKPYQPGCFYYSNPDYLAGLQYAEIEEEIANFSINHIKNGLSFGYVINFNNGGGLEPEDKDKIEHQIKQKLTGSENAGRFILSFNDGKEAEVTVEKLDVNDAHNQWESLRDDAKYQLLTAHGVTSPLLFGMSSATGFGSNADELNTASKLLQDYQIQPKQEFWLDVFKPAFELAGLETDLEFIPLRDSYTDEEVVEEVIEDEAVEDLEETTKEVVEMNNDLYKYNPSEYSQELQDFINCGEDISDEEWELVDERDVDYDMEDEYDKELAEVNKIELSFWQKAINLVSTGRANPNASSEQDKIIEGDKYMVRYEYYPKTITSETRDFCRAMIQANKLYRKEDIVRMDNVPVNPGFGEFGANTYSIWLYKGGARCHHKWRRKTFKAKAGDRVDTRSPLANTISTNQAEREGYRVRNPKEVAMKPKDMPKEGFSPNNPNT